MSTLRSTWLPVKAPRLLYARGFNQLQIKTGDYVDCVRMKRDYYSLPRWSHTPPTQFGARYQQFRFNDARGEARLQHITHEQDEAGFWITFLNKAQGDATRRIPVDAIDYIRGS